MIFGGVVEHDPVLGDDWIPIIPVQLRHEALTFPTDMLVDPGSHLTILSFGVGAALGLSPGDDDLLAGLAVGGGHVPYRLRHVAITIAGVEVNARVGWIYDDATPPLLGRLDVFDAFHFDFRQSERKLVVTPRA